MVRVVFREETNRFESIQKIQHQDDMWKVDQLFMLGENHRRLPPIELSPQDAWRTYENDKRIRVLAVGDSFTQGVGLLNAEDRWPTRLENLLNDAWGPGTVEVVNMSAGGAAMFDYSDWMTSLKMGKIPDVSQRANFTPPSALGEFDAVVLGFTPNDVIPGIFSKEGDDLVKVSPEDESGVVDGSIKDPNSDRFFQSVNDFVRNSPAPLVLWYNLEYYNLHPNRDRLEDIFGRAGYGIVPRSHINTLRDSYDILELAASPVELHPGPAVTLAYAKDIADYLIHSIPPTRIRESQGSAAQTSEPLLSSYIPTDLRFQYSSSRIDISYDPATAQQCKNDPAVIFFMDNYSIDCGSAPYPESPPVYTLSGSVVPPQMTPCAQLGHPYIALYFNLPLIKSTISTSYKSQDGAPLTWYLVSSDDNGFVSYKKILKKSNSVTLGNGSLDSSIVGLALADEAKSCSPTSPPAFPKLTASIVIR